MMTHLRQGDRVRIDIIDTTDPDFDHYHGRLGTVVETLSDDASEMTGDDRDNVLYRSNSRMARRKTSAGFVTTDE